jgi:S1-C subfamily serine protease
MSNPAHFEVTSRGNQGVGLRLVRPLQPGVLGLATDKAAPSGARVASIAPDSPAARAGVLVGDVIVELDGRPILTEWSLVAYIAGLEAGRSVRITLLRGGARHQLEATLAAR